MAATNPTKTDLFNGTLADGGPVYTETNLNSFVAEPFNAVTALGFLAIALYWVWRLRGQYREQRFLCLCLVLLSVGAIGGTCYHAFRMSRIFFLMDVVPIALILVSLSGYLWVSVLRQPRLVLPALIPFFLTEVFYGYLPRQLAITLSYCLLAALVLAPLGVVLKRTHFAHSAYVKRALGFFALGIFFRVADPYCGGYIPIGTHWLWHVFSAVAVSYLTTYLFLLVVSDELRRPPVAE